MCIDIFNRLNIGRLNWRTEAEVRHGWLQEIENYLDITFHQERDRADADYNQVIIEFKNVGLLANQQTHLAIALEELKRYIIIKAEQAGLDATKFIGIMIDGINISFANFCNAGGHIHFIHSPLIPLSPTSVKLVLETCKSSFRRTLTSENLIEDFGQGSIIGNESMQLLANILSRYINDDQNNKIKMLYEEWKALYGQVANLSNNQINIINDTIGFTVDNEITDRLSIILFVIHTFNSIIIKFLAAEIVSRITNFTAYSDFSYVAMSITNEDSFINLINEDIEKSELYSRANIHGFVEEPLFSWYIDAAHFDNNYRDIIVRLLKNILIKISSYIIEDLSFARTNDVLKRFYQNLVPRVLRRALGEFYTPDWLVELTLEKVNGNYDELRFLDPTCGSASFLLAIIRHIRQESNLPSNEQLSHILSNVWGFDLNPLAVQTSRVNYLIAISDLIADNPGVNVEIPVLLADAIYSPSPDINNANIVHYEIGSTIADLSISLPTLLAQNRNRLDHVFDSMEECIENNISPQDMMSNLVNMQILSNEERNDWQESLMNTYQRVLNLHRQNWNSIWFRIIRNYFWSSTAGRFDVIIGNPPWVRWSKLPELYRRRVQPTCQQYDIFSNTPHFGGNELDISGLITFTVADKWLTNNGQLIFLLTQTHFQSASSQGFRRFHISSMPDNYLSPISVDDLKDLKPFPDASNKTAILSAIKTNNVPRYPIRYTIWQKNQGSRTIPETLSKETVLSQTERIEKEATPINEEGSQWAILPQGEFNQYENIRGRSTWFEGRKGITCDLNGIYFVSIIERARNRNLVRIQTHPEFGRTNIGPSERFWIEPDLLYPLIKGAGDIRACHYSPTSDLCVIIPNRGIDNQNYTNANRIIRDYPYLYNYFQHYRENLENRSTYRTRMNRAPFFAIYNIGEYTFKPWKVIWPEISNGNDFPVAVVNNRIINHIRHNVLIPDHKIYFVGFDTNEPAYYLCGLLNCSFLRRFIQCFHVMLQVGDIFKNMRLPEYNSTNVDHQNLSALVEEAHNEQNLILRQERLTEISDLGNYILHNWHP